MDIPKEIMDAQAAVSITRKNLDKNVAEQRVRIARKIAAVAHQSQTHFYTSEVLFKEIRKELKGKGYNMDTRLDKSGSVTLISW